MEIRFLSTDDAALISDFYLRNEEHLRRWEPRREEGYHSIDAWTLRLHEREKELVEGKSAHFIYFNPQEGDIVAICSLTNIVRGPFMGCNMGYAVSKTYQGRGLMKKLCVHVIGYAFSELHLNRVMANYMPSNQRSEALLGHLGFVKEGLARRFLKINGNWEDHVLTSLVNPNKT
ncbi:GNAT family N-acetyltransferase [Rheinheimera sediminis]|uniref:GNAT family N-acetyltransferase n=1 Tax=Rheinheimera sp. YQF-1 TaxID=2499626 RepID=UPI000FDC1D63|nr:GNAT family N-acetyltransferase [Rheinheimera sp. YQF-1]RVT44212.1 GNAT family N-acetyltransferase [Rheinheimera sp. YQF-1]